MKILCLGDSLTEGYGVMPGKGYARILKNKYGFEVTNEGLCGRMAGEMRERLESLGDEIKKADACIIMGGANDIIVLGESNNACSELIKCADICRNKGVRPVIAIEPGIALSENPFYDFQYYDVFFGAMELLTLRLRAKCRENQIEYIDFSESFRNKVGLTLQEMFLDGVHPTEKGHEAMARTIAEFFGQLPL